MPQCTAADLKPVGAVMPPSIGMIDVCRVDGITSAMERRQRHAAVARPIERPHDGVLSALPELAAGVAVGHDLLGQPGVRNDREAEMDEVAGRMGEGAQLVEAAPPRGESVHRHAAADAQAACLAAHDHGSHFGNRSAERRQLRERHDFVVMDRDDEAIDVDEDFAQRARKQMPSERYSSISSWMAPASSATAVRSATNSAPGTSNLRIPDPRSPIPVIDSNWLTRVPPPQRQQTLRRGSRRLDRGPPPRSSAAAASAQLFRSSG
jgi:hypothetical protein